MVSSGIQWDSVFVIFLLVSILTFKYFLYLKNPRNQNNIFIAKLQTTNFYKQLTLPATFTKKWLQKVGSINDHM